MEDFRGPGVQTIAIGVIDGRDNASVLRAGLDLGVVF